MFVIARRSLVAVEIESPKRRILTVVTYSRNFADLALEYPLLSLIFKSI